MRRIIACILVCLCACFSLTACVGNGGEPTTGSRDKDYVVTLDYNAPSGLPTQLGPTKIEINKGEILNLPTYGSIESGCFISAWEDEDGNVILSGVYDYDTDMKLTAQWSWSSERE